MDLSGEELTFCCSSCEVGRDQVLEVGHMIEYEVCQQMETSR